MDESKRYMTFIAGAGGASMFRLWHYVASKPNRHTRRNTLKYMQSQLYNTPWRKETICIAIPLE